MKFLKSRKFWLSVLHIGVIGGGIAGAVVFPASVPLVIGAMGATNALLPSPLSKS